MKQRIRKNAEIIQIIVSFFIVALAGFDMIGKPARLVMILALVAGAIGIGVSIGVHAERRRTNRLNETLKNNVEPAA